MEKKYQQHVVTCKSSKGAHQEIVHPAIFLRGGEQFNINFYMNWEAISKPFQMEPAAMVHEFDQILCFMGGNITDIFNFKAVIEIYLGEEEEKYVITAPTIVHIPKGMPHGPLDFKEVPEPILFQNIMFAPTYIRKGN